jgi:threonine dehydratase
LKPEIKVVCTHSSGNNAGALAYASNILGLKAKIVMPLNSPAIKQEAVKGYQGEIHLSGNTIKER